MQSDKDIIEEFKKRRDITRSALSAQYKKSKEDWAFYHGDKDIYEKLGLEDGDSKPYMNMIQAHINAVLGYIIKLRREFKYMARMEEIQEKNYLTEACNNFARYIRENGNFNQIESEQDLALLVTGIGITDTEDDYNRRDLNGEIVMHHLNCGEVGWDCNAREKNLTDANYVYTEYKYPVEEALKLFPKVDKDEFEDANYEIDKGGNYLIYNPETGYYTDTAYRKDDVEDDKVSVYKYQWIEFVNYYKIQNPLLQMDEVQQQEMLPMLAQELRPLSQQAKEKEDDVLLQELKSIEITDEFYHIESKDFFKAIKAFCEGMGLECEYTKASKRKYCTAQITGDKVINKFVSKAQDGFSVKFKTGMFNKEARLWTGLVEPLKHPQHLLNKTLADMLTAQKNTSVSGNVIEEDAVSDIVAFERDFNQNGSNVFVRPGGLGKMQPKAGGDVPAGFQTLYSLAAQNFMKVSGINAEFLGMSENKQVSGVLEEQRIEQVTNGLAYIFDAINLYQIEQARLLLPLMRAISKTSTTRLIKVMGEDGAMLFKNIDNSVFDAEYEVLIEEAPQTSAQKNQKAEVMMQFARELAQMGQPNAYAVVVDYLPVGEKDKLKLKQLLEPKEQEVDPQAQQMQQAEMQMQMEQIQAQLEKIKAETALKNAQTTKALTEADKTNMEVAVVKELGVSNVARDKVNVNL